ncbi:MAG TPA: TonB-dependent receptor [Vicinamibacterales bacterium]|nr:TonB-dependent receptor [Vicinamibacterales bacterium]
MRITSTRRLLSVCLTIAYVCSAGTVPARAQVAAGEITGVVKDQAGAAVPGATITVTEIRTNRQRIVVSTEDGVYTAASLAPGEYRVEVELSGFTPVRREGIRITTGEKARIDFDLSVGGIQEKVTVVGDSSIVRAETASLGTVIENEQVEQLPLNGRLFIMLASIAPGVALPPNSVLPRINGGRPRTNEYLFDGISVLQPEPGQVAYYPIIDAIQEFKIESNSPPAEFGRFNGGVVNLTTKSGGNAFRGTLFEFFRNENLNARNYFQKTNPVKPEYRRNQFGGVLGGPLVKDRTFFFVDYQGQRQAIGRTITSVVPTLLQRQGIFTEAIAGRVPTIYDPRTTAGSTRQPFANNTIPRSAMDPTALSLLDRYPLPTSAGTSNNYTRTANELDNQDQGDVRLDHKFATGQDQVFGRLTYFSGQAEPVTAFADGSGTIPAGSVAVGPQKTETWAFASNYQHTFSGTLLNEVRVGDTRRKVDRGAAGLSSPAGSALNIPGIPVNGAFANTLPTFAPNGYQQIGSPQNTASDFGTSVTEIADSLTWLKGRHTVKMGLDWRWERLNVVQPPWPTGNFTFSTVGSDLPGVTGTGNAVASFLLGQVQNFAISFQQSDIQERAHIQEYFIQDDWKISDRLTINPGLRYTLNFPSTEINGQTAVFNLQTRLLDYPGDEPVRPLKKNNFGPRFGAVYRLTDRTVLSSGYGLVWIEMAGITTPFTTPTFPFLQEATLRTLDNISPAFVLANGPTTAPIDYSPSAGLGQGVFTVDAGLGSGYAQQWNASVQRELTTNTVVEVSYLGSKITQVGIPDSNINQLTEEQLALGSALLVRVPNPYFGIIPRSSSIGDPTVTRAQLLKPFPEYTAVSFYRNNVGVTNYQGVAFSVRQRLSKGLTYSAAYTYSTLKDTASSVFDASILTGPLTNAAVADSYNLDRDYDYSTGDIPHYFGGSIVWDLPFGEGRGQQPRGIVGMLAQDWSIATVVTLQSGVPVAVTQANSLGYAGFTTQRPNLVGDPTLPADGRSPDRWFNTDAFATANQFQIGTASRNPVRGPSYRDVDLAVMRLIRVGRERAFELRAEVFNLLNTANFAAPATMLGAANFGTITTALDPRALQLAVKYSF